MIGSSESWALNSTHFHGTHVPVEEPSTASIADTLSCGRFRSVLLEFLVYALVNALSAG